MRSLPPLNALRFFEAAARHGSFTVAAAELCVTPGAVSQQVHLLEERLGVQLFVRISRRVVLTDAGRKYADLLRTIFSSLAKATEEIVAPTRETLVVGVTPTFATKWLLPRLPEFQRAHGDLDIDVRISLDAFDFVRDHVDAALRHGRPPWPGTAAHFLFSDELTPVCSPELLTGAHPIQSPEDLQYQTLLHVTREIEEWPEWLSVARVSHCQFANALKFDSSGMALDVALAGLGVALGRLPFVSDELQSGRLVAPFNIVIRSKSAYYLAYPEGWADRIKIQVFRDWILENLGSQSADVRLKL